MPGTTRVRKRKLRTDPTPVDRVFFLFGKHEAAGMVGLTECALRKWRRPFSKGGGGGLIPARYQRQFLDAAREAKLPLRAEDLIAEPRL